MWMKGKKVLQMELFGSDVGRARKVSENLRKKAFWNLLKCDSVQAESLKGCLSFNFIL